MGEGAVRPATPGEGRSPDASDDAPAVPRFVTFADVAAEARRRIAASPSQRVSFPWRSDADLDRMVARFRRLAAELALAPLGDACLVDESAAYPDAGRRDFALTNDRGAALYEYSHWVGGSPGDALLARFVLLLEDGASVDVTVVDSCTQETIDFDLRAPPERLAPIARALASTLEAIPSVPADWLRR